MPPGKVHELAFLWFGLPGPLLTIRTKSPPSKMGKAESVGVGTFSRLPIGGTQVELLLTMSCCGSLLQAQTADFEHQND